MITAWIQYSNAPYLWMLAGALLVMLETMLFPGIGFLFAGIGAIITGVLIACGVIALENMPAQCAVFFFFSALSAVVLLKKMKRLHIDKGQNYRNMVGCSAIVSSSALEPGKTGEVRWSGTVMNARLAEGQEESPAIAVGSEVEIVSVSGNLLLVKPLK